MHTIDYTARQMYVKYDASQYLLYLNEQPATFTLPGQDEERAGYSYTGDMEDGSTIIEATDVTDENRRGKFIAGLINKRYSIDSQIALLTNGADTDGHARELQEFQEYRRQCKLLIDELLNR